MEINLEEALFYSKDITRNSDYYSWKRFRKYSKCFLGTTECISSYLGKESFNKTCALTVLAGGDQVFNLVYLGVKEIDAFDINKLQYFVYYLRKAMIESLSYEEFIKANTMFFSIYLDEIKEVLEKVKNNLKEDVYEYYRVLLEFCKKYGRLENLYYSVIRDCLIGDNNYLNSEESYFVLRKKLRESKVSLYFGDARNIPDMLKNTYDIVLLSNISDYLSSNLKLEDFQSFIASFYKLLNDEGIIINYLYGLGGFRIIKDSLITVSDLGRENIIRIGNEGYYRVRRNDSKINLM